jgi:cell wall-associated NlpC family hydrolase
MRLLNPSFWCLPACTFLLVLAGCAGGPSRTPSGSARIETAQTPGGQIASAALAQLGRPYRYGGDNPEGFDCSGLVRFAHRGLGIDVPRTTEDQYRAARRIQLEELEPGDLLFFRIDRKQVSHVAIYIGDGRFVHAPRTGRPVEARRLEGYYHSRLAGAGRFH